MIEHGKGLVAAAALGAIFHQSPVKAQAAPVEASVPSQVQAPAAAEDAEDAPPTSGNDIVVTGSRITRAGYNAPTPTTVVDASVLEAAPQPNVATFLNQLPALSGSTSPRTAGNGVGGGAQGANFLNLRSLGINRTLVLLDRRRVVASATTGAVDLNLLPTALLKRTDIVTGGASAAWGSDAVAGVVNLVLDTEYTGIKGQVQTGLSTYGDGAEYKADLSGGLSFAEGRGHIVASGSYLRINSIDRADSRPWYDGRKFLQNPAFVAGGTQPRFLIGVANATQATPYGLITAGPLRGTQFLAGGATAPFDFGAIGGGILSVGGTPNELGRLTQILGDVEQYSAYGRVGYSLTDAIKVYGEFSYGKSVAETLSVPYQRFANITIRRDNAYLPTSVATAMDAARVTNFQMGRTNLDLGFARPHNDRELYRYLAGTDIDLGSSFSLSAYYEHGLSKVRNEARNNAIVSNYNQAIDAVRTASGQIVCRSTLTNPSDGCVPFNVFGPQTPTDAQRAYLLGTAIQDISLTQDVASVTLNGDVFELPAGKVAVAVGGEYRREDHTATADANSIINNFWVGNYKPSSGGYDVKEAFGEILIPVFRDSPLGRSLDFNGAVRYTDYSTSGGVTTWKAGATYDVTDWLRFRGTLSRDIRAPNLNEYFLGGQSTSQQVNDPANGGAVYQILRIQSGNTALLPEKADTRTVGVVLQPRMIPGLSMSVDYYNIKINGSIGTLTNQQLVDRCFAGSTDLCGFIIRNAANVVTSISIKPINFRQEVMEGVDIEGSYRFALGAGSLSVRTLWNYTPRHYLNDNGLIDELTGEYGQGNGPAKLRSFNSLTWDSPDWVFSLRHRFIGKGVIDADYTAADIADNTVPAVNYIDASATARVRFGSHAYEMFLSVDNLFNKAPPIAPMTQVQLQTSTGRAPAFHDLVGRFFRAGVRIKM